MSKKVWMEWPLPPALLSRLTELAEVVTDGDMKKIAGSDVITAINRSYDGEFMDRVGPNLKQIVTPGIGLDNIDVDAATERGILVCNTPDGPTESTAEHAVALLMAVAKRVMMGDMRLRGGGGHRAGGTAGHGTVGQQLGHRRLRTHRSPRSRNMRPRNQDEGDDL